MQSPSNTATTQRQRVQTGTPSAQEALSACHGHGGVNRGTPPTHPSSVKPATTAVVARRRPGEAEKTLPPTAGHQHRRHVGELPPLMMPRT
jgi:hypothetical protein